MALWLRCLDSQDPDHGFKPHKSWSYFLIWNQYSSRSELESDLNKSKLALQSNCNNMSKLLIKHEFWISGKRQMTIRLTRLFTTGYLILFRFITLLKYPKFAMNSAKHTKSKSIFRQKVIHHLIKKITLGSQMTIFLNCGIIFS